MPRFYGEHDHDELPEDELDHISEDGGGSCPRCGGRGTERRY